MDRSACRGDRRRPAVDKGSANGFRCADRIARPKPKNTAMVPRGSQKTACLNHPPGHENDPRTPNGQRHSVETGTLLDLPRQSQASEVPWRSGRFQRPAGTEATRVARCEGCRTDERKVGVMDGAVHSSILPLSGFANPFPAPLPGGKHRPFSRCGMEQVFSPRHRSPRISVPLLEYPAHGDVQADIGRSTPRAVVFGHGDFELRALRESQGAAESEHDDRVRKRR